MSDAKPSTINRRDMLKGTAAAGAAITAGITFSAPGSALASVATEALAEQATAQKGASLVSHALCKAHHKEMARHLGQVLNASYVEDRMADVTVTTSYECAQCQAPVEADMKTRAAFATLK